MIKEVLKKSPLFYALLKKAFRYLFKRPVFTTSQNYWENRYKTGGNSGAGSYQNLAEFKAEVINLFVADHKIISVIDFGCGDGNQLSYLKIDQYLGLDVSKTAIAHCKKKYKADVSKQFELMENYQSQKAELSMSLDVIFHLIEDQTYVDYMQRLFSASSKYVIIYSSNTCENSENAAHFRHRKFTDWIERNQIDFELLSFIPNKYPFDGNGEHTSVSDFYIYQRRS